MPDHFLLYCCYLLQNSLCCQNLVYCPILYPFLQKFFVKGVMIGAVKG